MDRLVQDLRYAVRTLAQRRGFAAGAVLTLALGIGANTALFSVLDGMLLTPMAGADRPDRLAAIYTSDFSGPAWGATSFLDWADVRADGVAFEDVAMYAPRSVGVGEGGGSEPVAALVVSANYFDALTVRPHAGRVFSGDAADDPGDVAVVSHEYWRRELGGDPAPEGIRITVNGARLEVVGVAPDGFGGFDRQFPAELFIPVGAAERLGINLPRREARTSRGLFMVGRLATGTTAERAQARMDAVAADLHAAYPDAWTDAQLSSRRLTVVGEREMRVPPAARSSVMSLAGVLAGTLALVLLICCANVAGLLLARAASRSREIGIRVSLGAGRPRLIRQMLTESMVVAVLGGAAGTLIAFWAVEAVRVLLQRDNPLGFEFEFGVDLRVLGFTAAIALATGLVFGLAPALRATAVDVVSTLKSESAGLTPGEGALRMRGLLVAGQMALSLVLLVGALLLVRTLRAGYAAEPGFETENTVLLPASPLPGAPPSADPAATALALRERLARLPGIESASWGWFPPFTGSMPRRGITIVGFAPEPGENMEFEVDHVGPGFFETMGIAIEAGRSIGEQDRAGGSPSIVVNRSFADRFWPGANALGQRVAMLGEEWTIVGVAEDVQYASLTAPPVAMMYVPSQQAPRSTLFVLRTSLPADRVIAAATEAVRQTAPGWVVRGAGTVDDRIRGALFQQRAAGWLLGAFAALALLLSAVGLYGVVGYSVARRTREIGLRIALGAPAATVAMLFLRQMMPVLSAGVAIGLAAALALGRSLGGLLIGVEATDPATFLLAPALLISVALAASWAPVARAVRSDPVRVLRG